MNADRLRDALMGMVGRYGDAAHRAGLTALGSPEQLGGKPHEHWERAAQRRYRAVQRLSAALRDVELFGDCDERDLKPVCETPHEGYALGGRHAN